MHFYCLEIKTTTKSPNQKLARASVTMIFPVQSNFNVTDPKLKDDVKNQVIIFKIHFLQLFIVRVYFNITKTFLNNTFN
jgi:hypothetical protein